MILNCYFIISKISQFAPLIAVGGLILLCIGYFNMLPDDYENLAQSVIASNFFGNNILQAITTKNYWDVVNIDKPLMHTWYIGVLLQAFVFLAVILGIVLKSAWKDKIKQVLITIVILSLAIYLMPFSNSDKFYYFPFRLFEITLGGELYICPNPSMNVRVFQLLVMFVRYLYLGYFF